jgi:hypothetical protein
MATPDPILSAIARLEERLVERFEDWRRELLEARLERERSERADLREQALEFRRRLENWRAGSKRSKAACRAE